MPSSLIRIVLIAGSLGLDTFAVAVGIGVRDLSTIARIRVAAAFASAEVGMTFLGTLAGGGVKAFVGSAAGYIGFAALIAIGIYMIVETFGTHEETFDLSRGWGLFFASLSISLDALGIGFSIAYMGVPILLMLAAIALASGGAAALGLLLGRFLGARAGRFAGVVAGVVLILTGAVFGALQYKHVGFE